MSQIRLSLFNIAYNILPLLDIYNIMYNTQQQKAEPLSSAFCWGFTPHLRKKERLTKRTISSPYWIFTTYNVQHTTKKAEPLSSAFLVAKFQKNKKMEKNQKNSKKDLHFKY